jgi:serine/threonine protein kinase
MQWLEGEDLGDRLASLGTLSVDDTVLVAQKMAAALAAAHRAGIIHRDLKPANVFLLGGHIDAPKLLDFGVARIAAASELTAAGTLLGTPASMAPEMVRGDMVGATADVYAVGALMFRCLAGRAPFAGAHQDLGAS